MTPASIRVIVADDEPAARQRVVRLLARHSGVSVVAECATGDAALAAVTSLCPDLLLLDIQMPGLDGFDVVRRLDPAAVPLVVFITAYDRYALRAFEVHALDYLLKPFDDSRLDQTVAWARMQLDRGGLEAFRARLAQLVAPHVRAAGSASSAPRAQRFAIKCDGALQFLPAHTITHMAAEGCYARVYTTARSYLVRESLASLGGRLPPGLFARVHRSTIVNLDGIVRLEPLAHGEARLTLANGLTVKVSRNYRKAIAPLRVTSPEASAKVPAS